MSYIKYLRTKEVKQLLIDSRDVKVPFPYSPTIEIRDYPFVRIYHPNGIYLTGSIRGNGVISLESIGVHGECTKKLWDGFLEMLKFSSGTLVAVISYDNPLYRLSVNDGVVTQEELDV